MVIVGLAAVAVAVCTGPASAEPVTCVVEVSLDDDLTITSLDVALERGTAVGAFRAPPSPAPPCRMLISPRRARFTITATQDRASVQGSWALEFAALGPLFECDFDTDSDPHLPIAGDFVISPTDPVANYSVSRVACGIGGTTTTTSTTIITTTTTTTTTTLPASGRCAQPISGGANPVATDCFYILQVGVGGAVCTPACVCAPKGTLPATATDALICLQRAVGQPIALACPCALPTTTTTTTTASRLGACCSKRGCSIVAPEVCPVGSYLGDRDPPVCTAADDAACSVIL